MSDSNALAHVVIEDDLSQLSLTERLFYYNKVCESAGLNPLTQPFKYIWLDAGKVDGQKVKRLTLYAAKACTDQLRNNHNVSLEIISREILEGNIYRVIARATMGTTGRKDEDVGLVSLTTSFYNTATKSYNYRPAEGDQLANLFMKAETKAKRRVTLSICGLGLPDETEVDSIPGAVRVNAGDVDEVIRKTEKERKEEEELRLGIIEEVKRIIIDQNVEQSVIDQWLARGKASHINDLPTKLLLKIIATANEKSQLEKVPHES